MPTGPAFIVLIVGVCLFTLIFFLVVLMKLYRRASKEISFVRTGMGGQKVIMNGGSLVIPVVHEIIHVNMNTLRLEVACSPKPDPDVMRVPTGRTAKETHDEGQTEFSARDHSQAPRSGAAQGGRAEHG